MSALEIIGLYLAFGLPVALYFGFTKTRRDVSVTTHILSAFVALPLWPLYVITAFYLFAKNSYIQWTCGWCGDKIGKSLEEARKHGAFCKEHPQHERAEKWETAALALYDKFREYGEAPSEFWDAWDYENKQLKIYDPEGLAND